MNIKYYLNELKVAASGVSILLFTDLSLARKFSRIKILGLITSIFQFITMIYSYNRYRSVIYSHKKTDGSIPQSLSVISKIIRTENRNDRVWTLSSVLIIWMLSKSTQSSEYHFHILIILFITIFISQILFKAPILNTENNTHEIFETFKTLTNRHLDDEIRNIEAIAKIFDRLGVSEDRYSPTDTSKQVQTKTSPNKNKPE